MISELRKFQTFVRTALFPKGSVTLRFYCICLVGLNPHLILQTYIGQLNLCFSVFQYSLLVNIYGSREMFVSEFRNLLADRLLQSQVYDISREVRISLCTISI